MTTTPSTQTKAEMVDRIIEIKSAWDSRKLAAGWTPEVIAESHAALRRNLLRRTVPAVRRHLALTESIAARRAS